MIPNKELIENIVNKSTYRSSFTSDKAMVGFCEFLAKELTEIGNIQNRLEKIYKEKELLKENHKKEFSKVNQLQYNLQEECKHLLTKYHCDPAGGYDSYHTCEICGKEIGKIEYRRS